MEISHWPKSPVHTVGDVSTPPTAATFLTADEVPDGKLVVAEQASMKSAPVPVSPARAALLKSLEEIKKALGIE